MYQNTMSVKVLLLEGTVQLATLNICLLYMSVDCAEVQILRHVQ
jgi:hypothetical protein